MWWETAEELIINLMFTVFYLFIVFYLIHYIDFILLNFSILDERIILFP
jgi:hypothetical protein